MENNQLKTATRLIFALTNRGMLLDVFVFLVNLFLMRLITRNFAEVVRQASDGDAIASFALFIFCLGIFILPPLGATLKRWHFHRRLHLNGKTSVCAESFMAGCLFNPIFFFCLNSVIFSAINAFIFQFIYGNKEPGGAVFVSSILFGIFLVVFQTVIVYRYFSPPKAPPKSEFLRDSRSEIFGDVCIFLNMILFQVAWNTVAMIPFGRVSDFNDFAGRLLFLSFVALFIYFPPRIFYLAEDIKRRRVWLTIMLANSPVIVRVLFGGN